VGEGRAEPLPVAPRPFPDESMGSWLGRLAARYWMPLAPFAEALRIVLPLKTTNLGWFLMPALSARTLRALARVARLPIERLEALELPPAWCHDRSSLSVCPGCLFVNPLDVTSPYWKRAWLDPNPAPCTHHREAPHELSTVALRKARNFDEILSLVSEHERHRRTAQRRFFYQSPSELRPRSALRGPVRYYDY